MAKPRSVPHERSTDRGTAVLQKAISKSCRQDGSMARRSSSCRLDAAQLPSGAARGVRDCDRELAALHAVCGASAAAHGPKREIADLHGAMTGVRAGTVDVCLRGAADRERTRCCGDREPRTRHGIAVHALAGGRAGGRLLDGRALAERAGAPGAPCSPGRSGPTRRRCLAGRSR